MKMNPYLRPELREREILDALRAAEDNFESRKFGEVLDTLSEICEALCEYSIAQAQEIEIEMEGWE